MRRIEGHAAAAVAVAALVVAALSGCASAAGAPSPSPSDTAASQHAPDTVLTCQGVELTAGALEARRPAATTLPSDLAALLETSPLVPIDDIDDWFVAESGDDRAVLMRELDTPADLGAGDVRDFELLAVSATPGAALPIDETWGIDASTSCTPRIDLGGLGEVMLALDPDAPPQPDDRRVSLLATEQSCNSGQPATGRVEVIGVVETETAVELVIGVAAQPDGAYTCQGNPPTPFTVDLEQELGDRVILDASFVPVHEVEEPLDPSAQR